jgi:uncharacterized protein YndB with AHSA1/START domain
LLNQEEWLVMGTQLSSPIGSASEVRRDYRTRGAGTAEIALRVHVNADPRRILQALTVPEYLEAWMSHPDNHPACTVRASRIADSYRIDFNCRDLLLSSVTGVFRMLMPDKVVLTWRRFGVCSEAESVVSIVLYADAGGCLVELRHTNLPSLAECDWHRKLWRTSLHSLSYLYQASPAYCESI